VRGLFPLAAGPEDLRWEGDPVALPLYQGVYQLEVMVHISSKPPTWEEVAIAVTHQRDELRAENERLATLADERQESLERRYQEIERLRAALVALVDALHDATPDGPILIGIAEECAIQVLARDDNQLPGCAAVE